MDSPMHGALVATVVHHHTFTVDGRFSFPQNKILGVGSYGVVAAAFDSVRNTNLAIKRVRPYAEDEIYAKLSLRELRCLKLLGGHPNVCIDKIG
jgi:serine/threonine protein kinase